MPQSQLPTKSDFPFANVEHTPYKPSTGEVIRVGRVRFDVLEDGRNTENRLGAMYITVPPKSPGPPQHWHQMHDETFLVMKGTATFSTRQHKFTASYGDYVVVPTYAPHAFGNESEDEELVMYITFTPAQFVNYFRLMEKMSVERGTEGLTPEVHREAMAAYATLPTKPEMFNQVKDHKI